jgi:hypothetical protein
LGIKFDVSAGFGKGFFADKGDFVKGHYRFVHFGIFGEEEFCDSCTEDRVTEKFETFVVRSDFFEVSSIGFMNECS